MPSVGSMIVLKIVTMAEIILLKKPLIIDTMGGVVGGVYDEDCHSWHMNMIPVNIVSDVFLSYLFQELFWEWC